MRFKLASLLLFVSLAASASVYPKMECGVYKAQGRLKLTRQGFTLLVRENTSSPWEFLLLGGKPRDKFLRNRTMVSVEFSVPHAFSTPERPIVLLRKFLQKAPATPLKKIQTEACAKPH